MNNKWHNIWTAKIVKYRKHPNADHLRIVKLDLGYKYQDNEFMNLNRKILDKPNGKVKIYSITSATNFDRHDIVVLALPGAKIQKNIHSNTHESFTLHRETFRGIESRGMLCAPFELGLSDSPNKVLLILPSNTPVGIQFTPDLIKTASASA